MSEALDTRARRLFEEAIDLRGDARAAHIERACRGDVELRARVEALLAAAEKEDAFLSEPTMGLTRPSSFIASAEAPGSQIGPYKLLELIGEGGFGSVFLAEQSTPVRRRVALKIIKLGMDTRAVVARFEQERQALAVMDHPHIAKVFDAGATATGRPFFVMELVRGEPITRFCDRANLSISERLELFTQVCRAVQHAHAKGIIHRDIKPANVLVHVQDGGPFCKVIDFGIAKAVERPLVDKTVFTEFRQLIGTPEYMSPEQAAGTLDIDTRTDVYSLGVLLYELLAGVTPFDPQQLRSAAFAEIQRIIVETDPPRPSTRLSASRERLSAIAAQRRVEPARLGTMLRGELDWIVMRALEKNRARRYDSAGDFAADIERFLAGQPVQAAPQSAAYRLTKFVRRHRVGVTAAGLIGMALVAGLGIALWQARVAAAERDAARKSAAEAQAAKIEADARRSETERVAEFQADQLMGIDTQQMGRRLREDILADAKATMQRAGLPPDQVAARQDQLAKLLDDVNPTNIALKALDENIFVGALKAVNERFRDEPLIKARLLLTLGQTLTAMGLLDRAAAPMTEALAIRRQKLGNDHPDTLVAVDAIGEYFNAVGRLPDAEAAFRESFAGRKRVLGENHRLTIESMSNLGSVLEFQGKRAEAIPYYMEALEKDRRFLGEDDPATLLQMNNVGHLLQEQGKLADAEKIMREALERMRRTLHDDHTSTLFAIMNMGMILEDEGKYDEAEIFLREALDRRRRVLGENHADTLRAVMELGTLLRTTRRYAQAEPYYREALERRRAVLGPDHPDTLQSLNNMGALLESEDKPAEAEPYLREALERRQRVLGEASPATLWSMYMLGKLMVAQKKFAESEPLLQKSVSGLEARFGKNHERVAECRAGWANALVGLGRFDEAEKALLDSQHVFAAAESPQPGRYQECVKNLIALYEAWDKSAPGKNHAAQAAEWRGKLTAKSIHAPPLGQPSK